VPTSQGTTAKGTGRARRPVSDANGRRLRMGDGARFACVATLFACGAGDGNRTRAVSLGIRHGSVHCAQVTTSDVLANDLS
jgi:hypothetical protein